MAVQGDLTIGQNVRIVLQVMAELGLGGVFQNRLELGQYLVAIQLMRRAGVIVAQRHIGGFACGDGEGHADETRLHVIQAVGFRIEGDERRGFQFLQPCLEHLLGHDHGVVAFARCRDHGHRFGHHLAAGGDAFGNQQVNLRGGGLRRRRRVGSQRAQQRAQLKARVQLAQTRQVCGAGHQLFHRCLELQGGVDGGELARQLEHGELAA